MVPHLRLEWINLLKIVPPQKLTVCLGCDLQYPLLKHFLPLIELSLANE